MSVEERHDAVIELLQLEIEDGDGEYTLDLHEMYVLLDGVKALKRKIEILEDTLREIA